MANLSSKTGTVTTPVQAQISLANNATTSVQDFVNYESQEVTGFVYVDATTDLRCSFSVQVVKNGANVYEIAAVDLAGDDFSGAPLLSFSMSGSVLRATLPNISGFVSAYLRYQLSAPFLGGNYPLSVDGSQVVSGTVGASFLPTAGAAAAGILSTGAQTIAGAKTFSNDITVSSTQYITTRWSFGSYNDNSAKTLTGPAFTNGAWLIKVTDTGGNVVFPIYSCGGAGVAYRWAGLDPDSGYFFNNTGLTMTFAVSGGNTYQFTLDQNNAACTITRTAGSAAYTVVINQLI